MKKGFTLLELLVVVVIIGILAAVALPQYQLAVDKADYMNIVEIGRAVKNAQEIYYLTHGTYAQNWEDLDLTFSQQDRVKAAGTLYPTYFVGYVRSNDHPRLVATYDNVETGARDLEPGSMFCYAFSERAERVCKSLGKLQGEYNQTQRSANSYVLN